MAWTKPVGKWVGGSSGCTWQCYRAAKLALTLFGNVMVSPGALNLCAESGVSVTFLSETGH